MEINAGKINGGFYLDEDLELNGVKLGELTVQEDDADETLRSAIGAVDGLSASLNNENELIIAHADQISVYGANPHGRNFCVDNLVTGTYE